MKMKDNMNQNTLIWEMCAYSCQNARSANQKGVRIYWLFTRERGKNPPLKKRESWVLYETVSEAETPVLEIWGCRTHLYFHYSPIHPMDQIDLFILDKNTWYHKRVNYLYQE